MRISVICAKVSDFEHLELKMGKSWSNQVQRKVARIFHSTMSRPTDLTASWGSGEFWAVLPQTDEIGAREVATRFLEAIKIAGIVIDFNMGKCIEANTGWACEMAQTAVDPYVLIDQATQRLKESKKNCLIF